MGRRCNNSLAQSSSHRSASSPFSMFVVSLKEQTGRQVQRDTATSDPEGGEETLGNW